MFNVIMLKVDFCAVVFGGLVVSNQALISASFRLVVECLIRDGHMDNVLS
jgi:hypothetical protein